jgi:hypothetical protein
MHKVYGTGKKLRQKVCAKSKYLRIAVVIKVSFSEKSGRFFRLIYTGRPYVLNTTVCNLTLIPTGVTISGSHYFKAKFL